MCGSLLLLFQQYFSSLFHLFSNTEHLPCARILLGMAMSKKYGSALLDHQSVVSAIVGICQTCWVSLNLQLLSVPCPMRLMNGPQLLCLLTSGWVWPRNDQRSEDDQGIYSFASHPVGLRQQSEVTTSTLPFTTSCSLPFWPGDDASSAATSMELLKLL